MPSLGRVSVRRKYQILGLCLLSIAVFLILALFSRDPRDTTADVIGSGSVRNQAGVLGALAASGLAAAFGVLGAWAVPLVLLAWGWNRIRLHTAAELWIKTGLGTAAFLCGSGLFFLLGGENQTWVGVVGGWIGLPSARLLGTIGGDSSRDRPPRIVGVVALELGAAPPLRQPVGRGWRGSRREDWKKVAAAQAAESAEARAAAVLHSRGRAAPGRCRPKRAARARVGAEPPAALRNHVRASSGGEAGELLRFRSSAGRRGIITAGAMAAREEKKRAIEPSPEHVRSRPGGGA
jgi:hypothetical protein